MRLLTLLIVGFCGLAAAALFILAGLGEGLPRCAGLEARIDPALTAEGARPVSTSLGIVGDAPSVQCWLDEDGRLFVAVTRLSEPELCERLELSLALDEGHRVEGRAFWYGDSEHVTASAQGLYGTVTMDKACLPIAGEDRLIAYDLKASRDGAAVEFSGKVVLAEADVRRQH